MLVPGVVHGVEIERQELRPLFRWERQPVQKDVDTLIGRDRRIEVHPEVRPHALDRRL